MKVSVCIVTYNHAKYIAQTLECALMQQTDFDYEILIGEDDSSDGTREICKEYASKYPDKIRLFLNDRKNVIFIDGKPTGRWNFFNLLKNADGKYIALCEGDDYWTSSNKLQEQADFLDNHSECSICFHDVEMVDGRGQFMSVMSPRRIREIYTLDDLLKENFIPTCSVLFRQGLLTPYPDWLYTFPVADWSLHILNAHYGNIGYIHKVMGVYRNHGEGIWNSLKEITKIKNNLKMYRLLGKYLDARFRNKIRAMILFCYLKIFEKRIGMGLQSVGLGRIVDVYRRLFYPGRPRR
jgi:glycosyltransferase involved in cell wall biosynthesis